MTVVKENGEIVVRFSEDVNLEELQDFLDYIELSEITATSKATQEDVDKLAEESKRGWWEKNEAKYFPHINK